MRTPSLSTVVLGLGRSGEAAALCLRREGHAVTVLDEAAAAPDGRAERLAREGVSLRSGASAAWPGGVSLCVVSPGIPEGHRWLRDARSAGARVVSELEFGWSRLRARTLAVTGSHGKSTFVTWMADAAQRAGLHAVAAGNVGLPVSRVALDARAPDWLVLEVSSFQLETVDQFRPDIGVLLNLLPNHLDRHGTFAAYGRAKARLFSKMSSEQYAIVPSALRASIRRMSGAGARWVTFGTGSRSDWRWSGGRVRHDGAVALDLRNSMFDNDVLGPSAAAAAAVGRAAGIPTACLEAAARAFRPLPHRMEKVDDICGVAFINDSKATSLAALSAGIRQTDRPVRLIAGGLSKQDNPCAVKEMLAERCRSVYLIGKDADRLHRAWRGVVRCVRCGTLDRAVADAAQEAEAGEVVLLSPGCASFDQFAGYEDRGESFRRFVGCWKESAACSCSTDAGRVRREAIR